MYIYIYIYIYICIYIYIYTCIYIYGAYSVFEPFFRDIKVGMNSFAATRRLISRSSSMRGLCLGHLGVYFNKIDQVHIRSYVIID